MITDNVTEDRNWNIAERYAKKISNKLELTEDKFYEVQGFLWCLLSKTKRTSGYHLHDELKYYNKSLHCMLVLYTNFSIEK